MEHSTYSIHHSRPNNASRRAAVKGTPFFSKAVENSFFHPGTGLQRKCEECEKEEKVQRSSEEEEEMQMKAVPEEDKEVQRKEVLEEEER